MANERNDLVERIARAVEALGDGTTQEKLDLLLCAWLVMAANARNDQLPFPGGFTAEQEHQLQRLDRVSAIIRAAVPDLEGERLYLEGNEEAWQRHVLRQIQEAREPDDDSRQKGGA